MAKKRGPTWRPAPNDYRTVFREQNPWHEGDGVPEVLARRTERPIARCLADRLRANVPRRFQLILGPRRVGKSTAMYQAVRHLLGDGIPPRAIWWLRLDHPLLMQEPLGALCRYAVEASHATEERPVYLFLDELTYSPEWDLWLKAFYDDAWPVRVVGSSSSTAALRHRRMESGVGRWEEQYLAPYLLSEYLTLRGDPVMLPVGGTLAETLTASIRSRVATDHLGGLRRRLLLTGGFPELLSADGGTPDDEASVLLRSQRTLRSDAVERALYKDIPQAFGVDNPMMLERLLYTLAGQTAGLLSPNSICQNLGGLSLPTFGRYLGYLERAFLVFTLPNYSGSEVSVQKRGKKLYFVDAAVRNAALQRGLAPLTNPEEMGLLIENMAASHLHALGEESQVRLSYWRDKHDEVDLIYDHPESPLAFEVGWSGSHHRRGIAALTTRYPRFEGRCFMVSPDAPARLPDDSPDQVGTLPLDLFLVAVGAQVEKELADRLRG